MLEELKELKGELVNIELITGKTLYGRIASIHDCDEFPAVVLSCGFSGDKVQSQQIIVSVSQIVLFHRKK